MEELSKSITVNELNALLAKALDVEDVFIERIDYGDCLHQFDLQSSDIGIGGALTLHLSVSKRSS